MSRSGNVWTVLFCILFAGYSSGQIAPEEVQALHDKLFTPGKRMSFLRLPEIVRHLDIQRGSHVADIGCGPGELTVLIAYLVERQGRVYAEDIDPKALAKTAERVAKEGLQNVQTVLGAPDDPRLPPASLDAALILNTYHELKNPSKMLTRLSKALKPGGRLVVIDIMPSSKGGTREEQQTTHALAPSHAESDLRKAGFYVLVRDDSFTEVPLTTSRYWLIAARR